jgi:hypothetical protein
MLGGGVRVTTGTLDLNGYTIKLDRFQSGDSEAPTTAGINLNGGIIQITASNGTGIGGVPYLVYDPFVLTGTGKIQFLVSDTYTISCIDISTQTNYSNIDFEFYSTNIYQIYSFDFGTTKTVNNFVNKNTIKKTIKFNPANIINVKNLDLNYMTVDGNFSGTLTRATINYVGSTNIDLNNSTVQNVNATPTNKFIARSIANGGTNTDGGNNIGVIFGALVAAINSAFFLLF